MTSKLVGVLKNTTDVTSSVITDADTIAVAITVQHEHANKLVIDKITEEDYQKIQNSVTKEYVDEKPALTYIHSQLSSSAFWTVNHNMNKIPAVHVVDSGGTACVGTIDYPSLNTLTIHFSAPFSGTAYVT